MVHRQIVGSERSGGRRVFFHGNGGMKDGSQDDDFSFNGTGKTGTACERSSHECMM